MINFKAGFIPSREDPRDAKMPMSAGLPREVMAKYLPYFVYDQGNTSMCVANSIALVVAMIEKRQRGVLIEPSRGYIYGNRLETDYQGEGMTPAEALKLVSKFGVVKNSQLPEVGTYEYCKNLVASKLKELDGEGIPQRIKGYVRLGAVPQVCDFIERFEVPVIFGANITDSFFYPVNGVVQKPSNNIVGGHEMVILGTVLHEGKIKYKIQNSWGTTWGDNGTAILDPDYYSLEMWGLLPEVAEDIIKQPQTIVLTIGSNTMIVENKLVQLLTPPQIINGRTMIPVREVVEAIGYKVGWYPMANGRSIITLTKGGEMPQE